MSKTNHDKIGKILEYVLLRRPDEFLLVPDENGNYSFREVLKALSEKKDLSWITKAKINFWINSSPDALITFKEPNFIGCAKKAIPPLPEKTQNLPGELYTCIRKKAWPHVLEKGLDYKEKKIILFSSKEKAIAKGKRIDPEPVLLFVSTKTALEKGVCFEKFMDEIFLADRLEPQMFKGPSLDKTIQKIKQKKNTKKEEVKTFGSFSVNPEHVFPEAKAVNKGSWQKNKKKLRKQKNKLWPDEMP
jgi:putative RNA 2'-phosphotransferase